MARRKLTFLAWGALNALYFLPLFLRGRNRVNLDVVAEGRIFPSVREVLGMAVTFGLTTLAWLFFRAENIGHALDYISRIFSPTLFSVPEINTSGALILIMIMVFLVIEWLGRDQPYAIAAFGLNRHFVLRWSFYYVILALIVVEGGKQQTFIYFQF